VQRLKTDFQPNYCLSVNDDKQAERNQILVNNLEKEDNPIRAVFAVQKLNEGWDVLNLFDIVRCYETRDSQSNRPGKTTIAEAQLIGRGARYFPFTLPENDDEYKRKFDNDTENELRVLEELHYHSVNNPRYISEIRTALIDEGLMDENTKERPITLKASFKDTDFYEKGVIWLNQRKKRGYQHVRSFDDLTELNLKQKNHPHTIYEGSGGVTTILEDTDTSYTTVHQGPGTDISVNQIEPNIVFEAIARNPFYKFNNLKQYFPHLRSMQEFRKSEDYLGGLAIEFKGDLSQRKINPAEKLRACCDLLHKLESELQEQITEYVGTTTFQPHEIKAIFLDKTLKFSAHNSSVNYNDNDFDQIVRAEEWFAFDGVFYGTSDERGLVKLLSKWWNDAQNIYETFYLIRNEKHFCICNFSNGDKFYPDFVMFLHKKNGETLTYEIFVEPKGEQLQDKDRWKEDFLKIIRTEADTQVIAENRKYRVLGVGRFYNEDTENEFKDELNETLQQGTS
jgi:type III restriction enzyme